VGLPASDGAAPVAAVAGSEAALGPLVTWLDGRIAVLETLEQLKRFYWSWCVRLATPTIFSKKIEN
jgi:hypothetical protein